MSLTASDEALNRMIEIGSMNDPNGAAMVGYVLFALASLVGLAVGVKQLLRSDIEKNGSQIDVTRREFEELKTLTRETIQQLTEQVSALKVAIVELRAALREVSHS